MINDPLDLVGCEVKTHYGTGGKIIYIGKSPYSEKGKDLYTINYSHPRDGSRCILNNLELKEGQMFCEGIPLDITGTPVPRQLSLF